MFEPLSFYGERHQHWEIRNTLQKLQNILDQKHILFFFITSIIITIYLIIKLFIFIFFVDIRIIETKVSF